MDEIQVTARHIRQGSRINPKKCPVALALKEASGGLEFEVGLAYAVCWETGRKVDAGGKPVVVDFVRVWLPSEVSRWVSRFDLGKPVGPISFFVQ